MRVEDGVLNVKVTVVDPAAAQSTVTSTVTPVDRAANPAVPQAAPAATAPATEPDAAEVAAKAERERIEAIDSLSRPGQEKLVAECKADPKCTPEMAAFKILRAEGGTRSAQLRSLAADDANLEVPGPSGPPTDATSDSAVSRRIIAAHQKVTTPNRTTNRSK